jgi:hypothetical protein
MAMTTCFPLHLQWLKPKLESCSNGLLTSWSKTYVVQKADLVGLLSLTGRRYLV